MLKQKPQMMSAEQLAKELRDVRVGVEELRRQSRTLCGRTSQLYVQLERLKSSKGEGR